MVCSSATKRNCCPCWPLPPPVPPPVVVPPPAVPVPPPVVPLPPVVVPLPVVEPPPAVVPPVVGFGVPGVGEPVVVPVVVLDPPPQARLKASRAVAHSADRNRPIDVCIQLSPEQLVGNVD